MMNNVSESFVNYVGSLGFAGLLELYTDMCLVNHPNDFHERHYIKGVLNKHYEDTSNRLEHKDSEKCSYRLQAIGFKEELVVERERVEVLTQNIGNCMDTIAQQDKEIERLEDVIKVLSRMLYEEVEDDRC